MFLACGIGAGNQHQLQRTRRIGQARAQGQDCVEPFCQRPNPGAQLAWTVGDKNNGRSGIVNSRTCQKKNADGET